MKSKATDFGYALTKYLTSYLSGIRNLSPNTIHSYRDTFKLMLIFAQNIKGISPQRFTLAEFTRDFVNEYLEWLRKERSLCQRSCNQRLAAIHAFCRYLQIEKPEYIGEYQRILAIPIMKYHKPTIEYLSEYSLKNIISATDISTVQGRRDLAILSTLYDTGARVQELCDISVNDLYYSPTPHIMLTGKGDKTRYVPIMHTTAELLKKYCAEFHKNQPMSGSEPLFYTRIHTRFTRSAVSNLVSKYSDIARCNDKSIPDKVTPHTFRHTKAMHMCQAGIDIIYIRDILGHKKIETTEIYAKINVERIRDALENAYPELNNDIADDWNDDGDLMEQLKAL